MSKHKGLFTFDVDNHRYIPVELADIGWRVKKEPLIKDEKIRKAVRAWAEANGRDLFKVINEHFNSCKIIGYTDGGTASCDKIEFSTTIAGADKNYYYTIDELCGDDNE